jgi:hypothetical protein
MYKTVSLPIVSCVCMCVCETRSVTSREEHRLRLFTNRILRKKVMTEWRKSQNGEFNNFYSLQISLGRSNQGECGRRGMWHAWERTENCTRF